VPPQWEQRGVRVPGRWACELGGVDGLSFVASLVRSLAWPAAVVVAVVGVRHPSVGWLAVPPRRVKVGPAGSRPSGLNKRPEWWGA